ncbi:unnamed protein product [Prorocentrum cordatum]|uniref:EF-hand domain-containing protein n=1 Tax=Prorocentrum cordatum TaxID=2364126 RepID=A0ABN9TE26_9DINO|nr:unnamed protein product [Polarella glacialis]
MVGVPGGWTLSGGAELEHDERAMAAPAMKANAEAPPPAEEGHWVRPDRGAPGSLAFRKKRCWRPPSPSAGTKGDRYPPRGRELPPAPHADPSPPRVRELQLAPNAERGAAHAPGGWEAADAVVIGTLHEHGLLLEEILQRLPPAPGAAAPRSPSSQKSGAPGEEKLVEAKLLDSASGGMRRLDGPDCCGPEFPIVADGQGSEGRLVQAATTFAAATAPRPKKTKSNSLFHKKAQSGTPSNRVSKAVHKLVDSPAFELFCGCLILVNTVIMVIDEQFSGAQVGYDIGFYTAYGSDEWADRVHNESLFRIFEAIFAVIFTVEVALRIVGTGCLFFRRPTDNFDLAVVVLSDLSVIVSGTHLLEGIQLLRLLRAAKLLRLVKLVRTMEGFDSLHLMTTALQSSIWALFWSVLLLLSIQTFVAMIATNVFRSAYLQKGNLSDDDKEYLFTYWGTYTRSMLSLFELALANWTPICRWLMENLHEGFMVAALSYKLVMGIAVVGVINAVFMQETFKVAHTDDEIMVRMKMKAARQHKDKMSALFAEADADSSGRIQREEFRAILEDDSIKTWLASMDLDASDADTVFDLLRGDDDAIDHNELIHGIGHLRPGDERYAHTHTDPGPRAGLVRIGACAYFVFLNEGGRAVHRHAQAAAGAGREQPGQRGGQRLIAGAGRPPLRSGAPWGRLSDDPRSDHIV